MSSSGQLYIRCIYLLCGFTLIASFVGCGDGMDDIKAKMAARAKRNKQQEEKQQKDQNAVTPSTRVAESSQKQSSQKQPATMAVTSTTSTETNLEPTDTTAASPAAVLTEVQHRQQVIENLARIGAAIEAMRNDGNGSFPVLGYHNNSTSDTGLSWRVRLLPYLGYDDLYKQFDFSKPFFADVNVNAAKNIPKEFQDPSDPTSGRTRIQAVSGSGTAFGPIGGRALTRKQMEEEGINRANIAVVIETGVNDAINWIEPNDIEVELKDSVAIESVYPSGTLSIWGDGKVYELDPELSGEDQMLAFTANRKKSKRRKSFAHRAVAEPVVIAEEAALADEAVAETSLEELKPELAGSDTSQDQTQLVIPGDRDVDDEAVALAERMSRSSLVFSSYESYFSSGRYGDAWAMHLASLLLADDSLSQRFKWSETLGRPVYGIQVGYAVEGGEKLAKKEAIEFDILDDIDRQFTFHNEVFALIGAPGPKTLNLLRSFAKDGQLGPWAQVASRNLAVKSKDGDRYRARSAIADQQGNYCPSVKYFSEGSSTKYFIDAAQRDDLDLLVLIAVELTKDGDTELTLSIYDIQRRKRLYESFVLKKSSVDQWKKSPLSIDPVSRWIEEYQVALNSILSVSPLPEISVKAARNRLRELMGQTSTRISLSEFLEAKFYLDLGLISGVEYEKVAAKWSELGEANSLNSRDAYLRLEGIESYLPKDWEKPIDQVIKGRNNSDD